MTSRIVQFIKLQPPPEPEPEVIDEFQANIALYDLMQQFRPSQQHRILRSVAERLMEENGNRFEE